MHEGLWPLAAAAGSPGQPASFVPRRISIFRQAILIPGYSTSSGGGRSSGWGENKVSKEREEDSTRYKDFEMEEGDETR